MELLHDALLNAVRDDEAVAGELDEFGQRYTIDFTMTGPAGSAVVRSLWMIRTDEDFPRLVSCFVR